MIDASISAPTSAAYLWSCKEQHRAQGRLEFDLRIAVHSQSKYVASVTRVVGATPDGDFVAESWEPVNKGRDAFRYFEKETATDVYSLRFHWIGPDRARFTFYVSDVNDNGGRYGRVFASGRCKQYGALK